MEKPKPMGVCWCGCGETVSNGAFFVSSHDRKAEAAVLKLHFGGSIAGMLVQLGYGPEGRNLKDALDQFEAAERSE